MLEARARGLFGVIGFPVVGGGLRARGSHVLETWSQFFETREDLPTGNQGDPQVNVFKSPQESLKRLTMEQMSELAQKTMPLRKEVRANFARESQSLLGESLGSVTLGIHFRAGDMHWHPGHPTPPSSSLMIGLAQKILEEGRFKQVFVATDSPSFVRKLRKAILFPVFSVSNRRSFNFGWRNRDPIKNVLLDAYILSSCGGLLHSQSNVSLAARVFRGYAFGQRVEVSLGTNPRKLPLSLLTAALRIITPARFRKEKPVVSLEQGPVSL